MKKTASTILTACLLIALLLTAVSCSKQSAASKEAELEQETLTPVSTIRVSTGSITDSRRFGGTVTAKDSVYVMPSVTGELQNVAVKVGDRVEKDQVLAQVDASRDGQTYRPSLIKAPIAGIVTSFTGVEGSMVAPSSPVAVIENLDNLEITISVIERYSTLISLGNRVIVTFDAIPGETFTATVTSLSPTIDSRTRTRTAKARLDVPEPRVIAGMYANLNIIIDTRENVIVVPYSALTTSNDVTTCYVVRDGRAVKTVVTMGIRESDKVEILSGLKAGDTLVVRGQGLLADGSPVRIVE